MANLSVILQAQFVVTDTTLSPSPQIIVRQTNNPTLAATSSYYEPFFQTINGTKPVPLPAATIWTLYVRNLSNVNPITLVITPAGGGGGASFVLLPGTTPGNGGVFIYHQPAETSGGITALSIGAAAVNSVCILAAV